MEDPDPWFIKEYMSVHTYNIEIRAVPGELVTMKAARTSEIRDDQANHIPHFTTSQSQFNTSQCNVVMHVVKSTNEPMRIHGRREEVTVSSNGYGFTLPMML